MQIQRSGKFGRAPVYEAWEILGAFFDTPGAIASPRAFYVNGTSDGGTISVLYTLGGGVSPSHVTDDDGFSVRQFAPGTNQASVATLKLALPLNRNLALLPETFRPQFRYVIETVVERTGPLVAGVKMEIGVKDDPGNELSLVNALGLVIQSVSTVNGGNWTLWYKPNGAPGAGVTQGSDSGVSPLQKVHVKWEYFDTVNPSLNIYLNGVRKWALTASSPELISVQSALNEPLNWGVHSGGNPNTIGQVDMQYDSHVLVEPI